MRHGVDPTLFCEKVFVFFCLNNRGYRYVDFTPFTDTTSTIFDPHYYAMGKA
jgi:hypothetical protein